MNLERVIYTNGFNADDHDSWTGQVLHKCGERTLILFDDAEHRWAYPEEMEVIA